MAKFDDLKVGDVVLVARRCCGLATRFYKKTVSRITKTQIVVDDFRFRKCDGYEVGHSDYSSVWTELCLYDEELWTKELAYRRRLFVMNPKNFEKLNDEQITVIFNYVKNLDSQEKWKWQSLTKAK